MRGLIVLVALAVAACTSPVRAGRVVDKVFEPAHHEEYRSYDYVGEDCGYGYHYDYDEGEYNGSYECESEYEWRTHTRWVPDTWKVLVHGNCSTPNPQGQVECQAEWKSVPQRWWDQAEEGSWYDEREQ